MSALEVSKLKIAFNDTPVISDFNATFYNGLYQIKGKNGSGKSSLLKTFCGIYPIQSGEINLHNISLLKEPKKAKMLLYFVPDKPEVYTFITGLQFLKMLAQIKKSSLNNDLNKWLEMINLNSHLESTFSSMSLGTQRKFLISGMFIASPKIILLDEPFNGLDIDTIEILKKKLLKLSKNRCIVYTNHLKVFDESDCSIIEI